MRKVAERFEGDETMDGRGEKRGVNYGYGGTETVAQKRKFTTNI